MPEKPEEKIVRLMRDSSTGSLAPAEESNISVRGDGNYVAGGDLHVHFTGFSDRQLQELCAWIMKSAEGGQRKESGV